MRSRFVLIYTIIQIAKELCRVVLLNLEKIEKRQNDVFTAIEGQLSAKLAGRIPNGLRPPACLAAFSCIDIVNHNRAWRTTACMDFCLINPTNHKHY